MGNMSPSIWMNRRSLISDETDKAVAFQGMISCRAPALSIRKETYSGCTDKIHGRAFGR